MSAYDLNYVFGYILIHRDDIKIVSLDSSVKSYLQVTQALGNSCTGLTRVDPCCMGWSV